MTAVKTVNITESQKEERKTSNGTVWGEETNSTLLSTIPGNYRNPLVSALGAHPAETWYPNPGLCHPRCRVWGEGITLETVTV